jgi:hypothetical protein
MNRHIHVSEAFQYECHSEFCWGNLSEISQLQDFEGGLRIVLLEMKSMRLCGCGVD